MLKIIGLCGQKQCGKSSMARFIKELIQDQPVKEVSLAHPLKNFVMECFELVQPKNVWGSDADKNYPLYAWGAVLTNKCLEKYRKSPFDLLTARELLQIVGTDVFRDGDLELLTPTYRQRCCEFYQKKLGKEFTATPTIWTDLCMLDIKNMSQRQEAKVFIISDVRFHNEVDAVLAAGGTLVRIYRFHKISHSIPHPSEMEMEEMNDGDFKYVVEEDLNRTLDDLKKFTINMLIKEGLLSFCGGMV